VEGTFIADKEQGSLKLELQTNDRTLARIRKILQACETRIQGLYTQLIQEWGDADGKVECLQAGRIY